MKEKLLIGLSACLAGENVRFDGGHRKDATILQEMGKCFDFCSFCPEIAIGMGVPRDTVRLVSTPSGIQAVGVKNSSLNVTNPLQQILQPQREWIKQLSGYIVKKGSPSCGMERVKIYKNNRVDPTGRGIFTEQLMQDFPLLPVEEEGRLKNPVLLDSFIHRVYAYARWNKLIKGGLTAHKLIEFHTQYKMVLLSRNQKNYRDLGRLVAGISKNNLETTGERYITQFIQTLKIPTTRNGHVNVLQHLQGFLKHHLPRDEKQNLAFTLEKYRKGELPLIAPKVLLNLYFKKHKHRFIEKTLYLKPYPLELGIYTKL